MNKSYQCSRCKLLTDLDATCNCQAGVVPRPNHREKGDAELCRKSLIMNPLDQECANCKYRKVRAENPPCKDCNWEGEEKGYPYWESAQAKLSEVVN